MGLFKSFFSSSLDLLFPPSCPSCKKISVRHNGFLCHRCSAALKFIKTPCCSCCGREFTGSGENHLCGECLYKKRKFDKARSLLSYENTIAGLIHSLKYHGDMTCLKTFRTLWEQSTVAADLNVPDLILPVPLHINRLRKRGFNQSLLLAKAFFADDRTKIFTNLLIRQTDTPYQTGMSGKNRRENLKNAFIVKNPLELNGTNVLIVDDVFTTGTTVNECARVLKKTGCKRVEILTLCRADKIL